MLTFIVIAVSGIAIAVFALPTMFYINNPAGAAINPEITENYRLGKWNNKVYYSLGGGFMSLGREVTDADTKSFQPLNKDYAKDKNHIYYENSRISVDQASFYLDENIPKDKNHAYYIADAPSSGSQATIIDDADPKTYKVLEDHSNWGKDNAHYYFKTTRVDADYDSFEFINYLWAKDRHSIYLIIDTGIKKTTIDSRTFRQINNNYIQDNRQIAFASWIENTPPSAYVTLPLTPNSPIEMLSSIHLKHNNKVYLRGKPFDVDIKSFHAFIYDETTLSTIDGFSKDKNHVYLYDTILKEADPETFTITDNRAKDKNHEYWSDGKIRPKTGERH